MLPFALRLGHLDTGIRRLVMNINRIPDVYTNTTCEGHIWRDIPAWPTKDGWVHFNVRTGTNPKLMPLVHDFLNCHESFSLDERPSFGGFDAYTLNANFESHEYGQLFHRITEEEQEAYFQRADIRLRQNLAGWADLNNSIIQYLKDNFREDYTKMPFREPAPEKWKNAPKSKADMMRLPVY